MILPLLDATSLSVCRKARALAQVTRVLASILLAEQPVTRKSLNQHLSRCSGCTDADGAWSMRDAYDALEAAPVHGLTVVTRTVADFRATSVALPNPWDAQQV